MAHLFVVAGHGDGDPGACGYDSNCAYFEEAERVRVLARRIKELGGDDVTLADTDINFYASNSWLNYPMDEKNWQAVELHMDSAGSGAHGAHVITCSYGDFDAYDYALSEFISEMFPGRFNKLVGRSDLKNPKQAFYRGISYRLIENGFISDPDDLDRFNAHIDDIARGYLKAFGIEPKDGKPAEDTFTDIEGEDMFKVITADDGTRWLIAADGPHPILTDTEMYTCEGFVRKQAVGDTCRRASIAVLYDVLMRPAC